MPDITGIFSSTGNALEQQGFKQFGAYATDAAAGNLNALFGNTGPVQGGALGPDPGGPVSAAAAVTYGKTQSAVWDPTYYASAMASGIGQYDPKHPFLFKVRFKFNNLAAIEASNLGVDADGLSRDVTYTLKHIELPSYEFHYEDVNMYNFRTKVLTQITHSDLQFSMYDDVGNHSLSFVNIYLMLLQPAARSDYRAGTKLEDYGFSFPANVGTIGGINTSLRAAVGAGTTGQGGLSTGQGNAVNILESMTIQQFYVQRNTDTGGTIRNTVKANEFVFTNPRLSMFRLDEQDHEKSDAKMINASFGYDALYIKTGVSADTLTNDTTGYMQSNDLLAGTTPAAVLGAGSKSLAGASHNPFVDIIANQATRLTQTSVSGYLQKVISPNSLAGQALGPVNSNISGLIGMNAGKTIQNQGAGLPQLSLPPAPVLFSNTATPPATQTIAPGEETGT